MSYSVKSLIYQLKIWGSKTKGRTIVVTSLGKLQLQQLQQAGKLQVSSGQLIVSSANGGGQQLRYAGVGGTQQIRLVSRSSPSIVSQECIYFFMDYFLSQLISTIKLIQEKIFSCR